MPILGIRIYKLTYICCKLNWLCLVPPSGDTRNILYLFLYILFMQESITVVLKFISLRIIRLSWRKCIFLTPHSHLIPYSFQGPCPQCSDEDSSPLRRTEKKCRPCFLYVILLINWVRIRCGCFVALPQFLFTVKQWPSAISDTLVQNCWLISFSILCVCTTDLSLLHELGFSEFLIVDFTQFFLSMAWVCFESVLSLQNSAVLPNLCRQCFVNIFFYALSMLAVVKTLNGAGPE